MAATAPTFNFDAAHAAYHAYRSANPQITLTGFGNLTPSQQALWAPVASTDPGHEAYHAYRATTLDPNTPTWGTLSPYQQALWQVKASDAQTVPINNSSDPSAEALLSNGSQITPGQIPFPQFISTDAAAAAPGGDTTSTAAASPGWSASALALVQAHITIIIILAVVAASGWLAYRGDLGARAQKLVKGLV